MNYRKYEKGITVLRNNDNNEWIEKVSCWTKEEEGYNIYIFQVIVNDENDLSKYYSSIIAAIAADFQTILVKQIEQWNIYVIFECTRTISVELKDKIEQDKYSSRKMVWDNIDDKNIYNSEYMINRLFNLNMNLNAHQFPVCPSLLEQIRIIDEKLYETLLVKDSGIEVQAAIYLGGNPNE